MFIALDEVESKLAARNAGSSENSMKKPQM